MNWKNWGAVGLVGATLACGSSDEQLKKSVLVGAIYDDTASLAIPTFPNDLALAVGDVNKALADSGEALVFDTAHEDSKNDPTVAVPAAKALQAKGVKVLVVDSSGNDVAVNALNYADTPMGLPVICFACNAPNINDASSTDPDPARQAGLRNQDGWNFRTNGNSIQQTQVLVNHILSHGDNGDINADGKFKAGIYYAFDSPFGKGLAGGFQAAMSGIRAGKGLSAPIFELVPLPHNGIDPSDPRFGTDMTKLTDDKTDTYSQDGTSVTSTVTDGEPDVLLDFVSTQYGVAMTKAFKEGGYPTTQPGLQIFHNSAFRVTSTLQALGATGDGESGISNVVLDNGASGTVFESEFELSTGNSVGSIDAGFYDATVAALLGTLQAVYSNKLSDPSTVTPAQIRDGMKKINDPAGTLIRTGPAEFQKAITELKAGRAINYEGASGPIDFDELGNVQQRLELWKIQSQQFVQTTIFDCVADPATCPAQ